MLPRVQRHGSNKGTLANQFQASAFSNVIKSIVKAAIKVGCWTTSTFHYHDRYARVNPRKTEMQFWVIA